MATIRDRYILEMDTAGANRALSSFKAALIGVVSVAAVKQILDVTARFEDLRSSLNAVTKSAVDGGKAFEFVKKFASETQFSVEDLTNTYIKLRASGIIPTERLLRTFADTAAITTDQVGSLQAITDLLSRTVGGGLGLEDLERLADRGVPVYRILEEQIGLTRLELSEFGKTAEGARKITEALLKGLDAEFGGATAGRLQNLSTVMSNFRESIVQVTAAFGEGFSPAVKEVLLDLTAFLNANQDIARSLGQLSGEVLRTVADAIKALATSLDALTAEGLKNLFADLIIGLGEFIVAFDQNMRSILSSFGQLVNGILEVQGLFDNKLQLEVGTNVPELLNELKIYKGFLEEVVEATNPLTRFAQELASNSPLQSLFGVNDNPVKQLRELDDMIQAIETGNYFVKMDENLGSAASGAQSLGERIKAIGEELRDSANVVEVYPDRILRIAEAQSRLAEETGDFIKDVNEGVKFDPTPAQEFFDALITESRSAVDELQFAAMAIEGLNEALAKGVITPEIYANAMERINAILGITKTNADAAQRAMERVNETSNDFLKTLKNSTEDAAFEFEALNMDPLEQQVARINRDLDRDLKSTIEQLQNIEGADAGQIAQQIQAVTDATRAAQAQQAELAQKSYEYQRTFAFGWKDAFNQYKESATNAASTAARVFNKTTKGMEDSIVNFAKTGKFEFKDLVNTILEELLRSQIQGLIASTFGAFNAFGGGAAGGGSSPFAGFFANGGLIPSGQFGVVGERGPELISGPANITPMDNFGGSTQVVYNINAVDAPSFKAMIARDPGFIHAVAQQGARSVPLRR